MEDVAQSQQKVIEESIKFLSSIVDRIENFQKNMPPQFWQLSTEKFDGEKLYGDLTVALVEVLRLERAAKEEISPVEEIPAEFSQDSK